MIIWSQSLSLKLNASHLNLVLVFQYKSWMLVAWGSSSCIILIHTYSSNPLFSAARDPAKRSVLKTKMLDQKEEKHIALNGSLVIIGMYFQAGGIK